MLAVVSVNVAEPPVAPDDIDPRKKRPSVRFGVLPLTALPLGMAAPLQYMNPFVSTTPDAGIA